MKKLLILTCVALSLVSCYTLQVPTTTINGQLENYAYAYVIQTSSVTGSSGVYGNKYGVYGGTTKTTNPSEVIVGYLMKCGYTILPEIDPNLADKTLIVNYGHTGKRQLSMFAYSNIVMIQIRDAKTHNLIAQSEAEGCGADEAEDILQAINRALDSIFIKQ